MKKLMQISLICLNLGILQVNATCDWPTMNHDFQNTRSNPCETTLNSSNVANLQVKWSFPVTGGMQIAPLVYNNVLYFGDLGGNFYAKNPDTGVDIYPPINFGASCPAAPSISNSILYITTGDLQLRALNLDLTPNLTFNGGLPVIVDPNLPAGQGGVLSAPVVVDNIVIVGTSTNGSETTNINMTLHGGFNAFDATTGASLWRTPVSTPNEGATGGSWSTAAVDSNLGLIFVGTTNSITPPSAKYSDSLLAIDYTTGEIVWSRQYTANDVWGALYPCGTDFDMGASPNAFTIRHNRQVIGAASKEGVYRVFRRDNGNFLWKNSLIPQGYKPSTNSNPSSAYADDVVYAIANATNTTTPQGPLTVLAFNGNQVAFAQFVTEIATKHFTIIKALDADNGHTIWSKMFPSATFASLTEANGVLYTGNFVGTFSALDAQTGNVLFTTSLGAFNTITAPITVTDGKVFIGTGFGNGGEFVVYSLP